MTKKDLEMLASIISILPPRPSHEQVARAFAAHLLNTNHAFSVDRFLEACRAQQ